jgi:galactose mutarotase-like enzyme
VRPLKNVQLLTGARAAILGAALAFSSAASHPYAAKTAIPKLAAPAQCSGVHGHGAAFGGRRTFLLRPAELVPIKAMRESDPAAKAAVTDILERAELALTRKPGSVMDKRTLPPSGDPHDYLSLAPYWWPNPSKPAGPYVRRDGEVNPGRATAAFDRSALTRMITDSETLALAYFYTEDPRFARKAAAVVRTWFLDPKTRMNPNMNYAQGVPGIAEGRAEGVLDTSGFTKVIDAVGLFGPSNALKPDEVRALEQWFGRYLDWMRTSPNGKAEQAARNNHALWYDAQLVHFALFARRPDTAEQVVRAFPTARIAPQFDPSGALPEELARTRSFHYSLYALAAAYNVADLAACLGYDLWNYSDVEGRSLRKATEFVAAYRRRREEWPHKEREWPAAELEALLRRADAAWPGAFNLSPTESRDSFGTLPDGRSVERFRLVNARGTTVELISYGAAIARIALKGEKGAAVDVVVGPDNLAGFVNSRRRFGAIVGRYAGRLRGSVRIDGKTYPLAVNPQGVTLHGGDPGFDRALWFGTPFETPAGVGVAFTHVSPHGDQGFPGRLMVTARYTLERNADALTLDIEAVADRPTVANLTNHVYFNLAGEGTVACHALDVEADSYVAVDARNLPTGTLMPVKGSRLDFTSSRLLGETFPNGGLNDMLVLRRAGAARLSDRASGRFLTLTTDQPGLQVFTGNSFDGTDRDQRGVPILRHAGVAIEPGHFPDSPWFAHFPSTEISPSRPLRWHARWSFDKSTSKPPGCPAS